MIQAKVVADSKNEFGNRITTMVVTFPRIILAEFNTHRMFSRNSASSRAIPFRKMLKSVKENPFIPLAWQEDHSGMQGTKYLDASQKYNLTAFMGVLTSTLEAMLDKESKDYIKLKEEIEEKTLIIEELLSWYQLESKTLNEWWLFARDRAIEAAAILYVLRGTKQLCNRLIEPFMWHTVIVTATEWENFFALRCPNYQFNDGTGKIHSFRSKKDAIKAMPDLNQFGIHTQPLSDLDWLLCNKGQAEIHMMALAEAMWDAYNESTPKELKAGEWHIPFGDSISLDSDNWKFLHSEEVHLGRNMINEMIKIATAKCARVSYTVVGEEGKPDNYENDIKLHDRLAASGHWSPFEHCAKSMSEFEFKNSLNTQFINNGDIFEQKGWSGNFRGFIQYRKMFDNENITV